MKKLKKILHVGALATLFAVLMVSPVLAATKCDLNNEGQLNNIGLSLKNNGEYQVKCPSTISTGSNASSVFYGKSQADCARLGSIITKDDWCKDTDLTTAVSFIINTIIFIVGMLAVVMIVIGGINYATSQGDPSKVKKAKDTILYGIIGLVVALLAFAIVQFVLNAIQG